MVTQPAIESDILETVSGNLVEVKRRLDMAAKDAGRPVDEIALVAVGKAQPVERVRAALIAGHRIFGENRMPEAEGKWPDLRAAFPDVRLHLVGPLQTNNVRRAVALFDVIESVDRPKLARFLAREMEAGGRRPDCLIQVNTGEEEQKAGVAPGSADDFIRACREEYDLPVQGLMCIPPTDEEPSLHFALLREIAARNGLRELSMGMSGDFEIAARFGATSVRVGTAIFGRRPGSPVTRET